MADPAKIDPSDWLSVLGAAILAGVGGAMAWFNKSKASLLCRMEEQDERIGKMQEKHAEQDTQLAVIHSNQDHMSNRLDEIRETTQDTNQKMGKLSDTLTTLLISIKNPGDRN